MWKSIRRALTRDVPLKLAALVSSAAILLVLLITRLETDTIPAVPIRLVNIPPNFSLKSQYPETADVEIHGPREQINTVKRSRVNILVPMEDVQETEGRIYLKPEHIRFDVEDSDRNLVEVDAEKLSQNVVIYELNLYDAVLSIATPALTGTPAKGLYTDASLMTITPASIRVTAAPQTLTRVRGQSIPLACTEIDVTGHTELITSRAYEILYDRLGVRPVDSTLVRAEVTIRFEVSDATREFRVSNIEVQGTPLDSPLVHYKPTTVRVVLKGRERILQRVRDQELRIAVDGSAVPMDGEEIRVPARVLIPGNLDLAVAALEPPFITLQRSGEIVPRDPR